MQARSLSPGISPVLPPRLTLGYAGMRPKSGISPVLPPRLFLGQNEGKSPELKSAVRELGTWIGSAGHTLVYGGSKRGLMGELAESVLLAGGEVIGVEP